MENGSGNKNLIPCSACGNMVSKKANTCPACGNPIKKSKKKLGCAIGCLTPFLIILIIIISTTIVGKINDLSRVKKYEKVVEYITEHGTQQGGDYILSENTSLGSIDYKISSCVDGNENIYFLYEGKSSDIDGITKIKIKCNKNKEQNDCESVYYSNDDTNIQLRSTGVITGYFDSRYQIDNIKLENDAGMTQTREQSFLGYCGSVLTFADKQIQSFNLGITLKELYGY